MTREDRTNFWGSIAGMIFSTIGIIVGVLVLSFPTSMAGLIVGAFCFGAGLFCLYAAARLFFLVWR